MTVVLVGDVAFEAADDFAFRHPRLRRPGPACGRPRHTAPVEAVDGGDEVRDPLVRASNCHCPSAFSSITSPNGPHGDFGQCPTTSPGPGPGSGDPPRIRRAFLTTLAPFLRSSAGCHGGRRGEHRAPGSPRFSHRGDPRRRPARTGRCHFWRTNLGRDVEVLPPHKLAPFTGADKGWYGGNHTAWSKCTRARRERAVGVSESDDSNDGGRLLPGRSRRLAGHRQVRGAVGARGNRRPIAPSALVTSPDR